jgi:hypothetical protein
MKTIACVVLALALAAAAWPQEKKWEWSDMRPAVGLENTVCLRGESALSKGAATVSLPAGFEAFTRPEGRTVLVTCIEGYSPLSVSRVTNGRFTVSMSGQGNVSQAFFWEVKAECASSPDQRGGR